MKLEIDTDDIFVTGAVLCVIAIIWALSSCEKVVNERVKERMHEVQTEQAK